MNRLRSHLLSRTGLFFALSLAAFVLPAMPQSDPPATTEPIAQPALDALLADLNASLAEHEPAAFAGLWIEHAPRFRVIVQFAGEPAGNLWDYVPPELASDVTVHFVKNSLQSLELLQARADRVARKANVPMDSAINIVENRLALMTTDAAGLLAALKEANEAAEESTGLDLLEGSEVVEVESRDLGLNEAVLEDNGNGTVTSDRRYGIDAPKATKTFYIPNEYGNVKTSGSGRGCRAYALSPQFLKGASTGDTVRLGIPCTIDAGGWWDNGNCRFVVVHNGRSWSNSVSSDKWFSAYLFVTIPGSYFVQNKVILTRIDVWGNDGVWWSCNADTSQVAGNYPDDQLYISP